MKMIGADALEKFLKRLRRELPKESRDFFTRDEMILNFQQYVHMQPTIDAAPVVRGEWIEHEDEMECPQCGYFWNYCDNDTERFNYCPNCGAKMESEGST